jgi:O-antigen/teichoic acid export membrane protein
MKNALHKLRTSALIRNTGWMLAGNGVRLVIQAAYFILVARSLGPQSYGAFAAAVALVSILSPFVGLGCASLMIKHVARDQSTFPQAWGNGLFLVFSTGTLGIVLTAVFSRILAPSIPIPLLLFVSLSELLLFKVIEMCAYAFGAFEMMGRCAHVNASVSISRLLGIAILTRIEVHPTATHWGAAYLLATAVATLYAARMVRCQLGKPRLKLEKIRGELREGMYFSASLSAKSVYNDIDKTMLARLGSLSATGTYAAAYRLVDVCFVPVASLMAAAYPRFFREGSSGLKGPLELAKKLLVWSVAYAGIGFLLLLVCAPIVPRILGSGYANTVESLRWLALLPVLKACHYLFADAITGAGFQGLRTLLQIVVAVFNVLINFWLIPAYSWRGAAWSSLLSDGLLALLMWTAAIYLSRREKRSRLAENPLPFPAETGEAFSLEDPTC